MPKISVIVPVYNTEKYLHRCIDSILAQTFTDFELLLIDDGSKDNSGTICDEYAAKDSRVRVFHKENGGVSSARNLGLDNAGGEWIAFVDSDDYVLLDFLETYMTMCKDDTDLCICGILADYSITTNYKFDRTSVDYDGDVKEALLLLDDCQMIGSLCNKLFKKTIISRYHLYLNECYKFREDEEFLLHYMCHIQKVVSSIKKLYVYFVPNFQKKYAHTDNFLVNISIYCSVLEIYDNKDNKVTRKHLSNIITPFFYSFHEENVNHLQRTKIVKQIIGKKILYYSDISLLSRILLYFFPPYFVTIVFKLKAKIIGELKKLSY